MELIEDQVYCEIHTTLHDKTLDPYDYGDEIPECGPEHWRKVWIGGPVDDWPVDNKKDIG